VTYTQKPVENQRKPVTADADAGGLILRIDLFIAVPSYELYSEALKSSTLVTCPKCHKAAIGIFDLKSPCCQLPIEWTNNKLLDTELKEKATSEKAPAKREQRLANYMPGARYLIEQACIAEDAYFAHASGTCKVIPNDAQTKVMAQYELKHGEAFIRGVVDSLRGEWGMPLINHVVNKLPFAANALQNGDRSKANTGSVTNGSSKPEEPKYELSAELRAQLGLE
jgi:hypothetical protein